MTYELRPYQRDIVQRVRAAYVGDVRAVVMQMATGSGKTATASEIIRLALERGSRVIFAAHLDALIDDTSERLTKAGVWHGIVQADRPTEALAPVQVASLPTLHRRLVERPPADLIIVDECHRALAKTVRAVLDAYPSADVLGLTATPQRGDGQPLRDVFQAIVCGPSMRDLTELGHLVPSVVYSPAAPLDGALAMAPHLALERYAPGEAAMVFCATAEEARRVAAQIGPRAVLILGETARVVRRDVRARLEAGEKLVLVGCGVFLEGWDSPRVSTVVLARALSTTSSYLQACGRALRPASDKTHAKILDLTGAAMLHGLPEDERVWTLDGVRRTGAGLAPLARCGDCFAIFPSGPKECPRCGAVVVGRQKIKRRLTRVEAQELRSISDQPAAVRDEKAIYAIMHRIRRRGRFNHLPDFRIRAFAVSIFRRKNGRLPGEERGP